MAEQDPATEAQIRRLRAQIGQFKGQITRATKFTQEQKRQVLVDTAAISLRIRALQEALLVYRDNYINLQILQGSDDDADLVEDDVEEACLIAIAELQKVTDTTLPTAGPSRASVRDTKFVEATPVTNHMTQRLPQLEIPTYDGASLVQYKSFSDMFHAVIGSDKHLAPVQKLFYLRKYLKGDALLLIEGLPLVNESYQQAITLLRDRYDNKCILITHHINLLLDIQPISKGTSQNLRRLVSQARQHLGALQGLGQKVEYWDMVIVTILIRKLDSYSCRAYFTDRDQSELPTLNEFFEFVEKRAMSFEESHQAEGKSAKSFTVTNHASESPVVAGCRFCEATDHKLYSCKKFQSLSISDKIGFVNKNKLCKICLNSHNSKCRYFFKCGVCKSKIHNTVLHEDQQSVNNTVSCQSSTTSTQVLLPTIKVKILDKNGSYVCAKGLLDSGSQTNFITSDLMCKLGLPTFKHEVKISALGQKEKSITKAANITLNSLHNNYNCNALFSVVDNITSLLPQNKFDINNLNLPGNILLADDEFNIPSQISFLLSSEVFFRIMLPDKIDLTERNLCLLSTKFGYVISGKIIRDSICLSSSVVLHAVNSQNDNVDLLLQKFWDEQHTPEIYKEDTSKQDFCEAEFKKSVQLIDNRFQVQLPLKIPIEDVSLGQSFDTALQRLNHLSKRFSKDSNLKQSYSNFIQEYIDLGHAKVVDITSVNIDQYYFMPHHPVLREDSKTTKLRVVFDASAKTKSNLSLNDFLYNGPVVQKSLFDILVLFRSYEVIALCDIRQMYRQIRTDPSQNHLQNILWRTNINDSLKCLQLQTVTYGVRSSSFLATRCLIELAERYGQHYPQAASVLVNNTYVDDCIFGAQSNTELKEVCDQLINLLRLGSFELHKWSSNNYEVLSNIPSEKQVFGKTHDFDEGSVLKALGLFLDVNSVNFRICKPSGVIPTQWTKRTVLSVIGAFFDPLGLAGPIVTRAKELMQKLWKEHLQWDSQLSGELLVSWNDFFTDLMNMNPIIVNRNLKICNADCVDLVGYCDASAIAYGCCVYVRTTRGNKVHVSLVCSKSRIAPVNNKLTIPKLELNGAALLSNLFNKVESIFKDVKFRHKFLFTDSQIVLYWLKSLKNPAYIQNRINMINNITSVCKWHHVASQNNAADVLSRGVNPTQLASHTIWWHGPQELHDVNFVPKEINVSKVIASEHNDATVVNCNTQHELLPISNISSIVKLQRVYAYVFRFIGNCKVSTDKRNFEPLTVNEIKHSMSCLIKHVQQIHFADEIKCINAGLPIKTNLKPLNPFIDSTGIMRVAGRLDNASSVPYNQKHPIILPCKCHLTTLIVRNEHLSLLHSGIKLTLAGLTQRFYIVAVVREIKKIIHKCTTCFRLRAERSSQLMGSLPHARVNQDRVFSKIGIDYCGPFKIRQSSLRRSVVSKGYVLVIVCFLSKNLHFELVSDLTTQCFLAAFKRFCARRGMPSQVYCDNASTYKGANNQLRQLYLLNKSEMHKQGVINYCTTKGIEFCFIPSYSPSFGGIWEAAVKSFKYHFKRVVGDLSLTYEQFCTVMVQIEGTLNSRPLTPLSNDINDFTYLTPAHFVCGAPLTQPPEPDLTSTNMNHLKFWKKCTKIQQDFWKSWHKVYLTQLLKRFKWQQGSKNVNIGDLVLLIEERTNPLHWPLARITNTFPGTDGRVRVVQVKTASGGSHRRAINKVAVLPIYDN